MKVLYQVPIDIGRRREIPIPYLTLARLETGIFMLAVMTSYVARDCRSSRLAGKRGCATPSNGPTTLRDKIR